MDNGTNDDMEITEERPGWYSLLPGEPAAYAPFVFFTPGEHPEALTDAECDKLLGLADGLDMHKGGIMGAVVDTKVRDADIATVPVTADTMWLFDRLMGAVRGANGWWNFDLTHLHMIEVGKYEPGQHYVHHIDLGPGLATRKLSLVVMLSNPKDYTGGDLELRFQEKAVKAPKARGAIVVFPAWTLHRVTPVKTGVRRTATAWVQGPAFR